MQTETSVVQLPMASLLAPLDSGLVSDVFHFLLQQTLGLQLVAVDLSLHQRYLKGKKNVNKNCCMASGQEVKKQLFN